MVTELDDFTIINLIRRVDESYPIYFGANLFSEIADNLVEEPLGSRYAIITDENLIKQTYQFNAVYED